VDSLVELVPQSGLVRLGATYQPCVPGPDGHLTVHGHELRPLTLAECDLIAAYAAGGGPEVSAALAVRMASVVPIDLLAQPDRAGSADAGPAAVRRAAVEAVALYLAGATGSGSLRGAGAILAQRLGLPVPEALQLTVLAVDGLAALAPAPPAPPDDGWTTFELVAAGTGTDRDAAGAAPPEPRADDDAAELRRVRDLLAARLAHRLADLARPADVAADEPAWPDPVPWVHAADGPPRVDRWGAPVVAAVPADPQAVAAPELASTGAGAIGAGATGHGTAAGVPDATGPQAASAGAPGQLAGPRPRRGDGPTADRWGDSPTANGPVALDAAGPTAAAGGARLPREAPVAPAGSSRSAVPLASTGGPGDRLASHAPAAAPASRAAHPGPPPSAAWRSPEQAEPDGPAGRPRRAGPRDEPEPARPGSPAPAPAEPAPRTAVAGGAVAVDLDDLALRLAEDLLAIADLHGVAR
jgi:hypothetical protein